MIFPDSLRPGDKIAIISPATTVRDDYIDGAVRILADHGFSPVVMPSAKGPASGTFASTVESRVDDLRTALHDTTVKAIFCARGGYGCIHLLPFFSGKEIRENAKWIIGFSDVSALHALWHKAGVASLHAPMAKHLTSLGTGDPCTLSLLSILTGDARTDYKCAPQPFNRKAKASGMLLGGNLAVLNGLASTPYDLLTGDEEEGVIMFLEDIAEPIYKVERVLTRLILSGVMKRIKGLIIGQFTEYKPDLNHSSMEQMIDVLLRRHNISGIPVAFNFPTGHVDHNLPLIEGDFVTLDVSDEGTSLKSATTGNIHGTTDRRTEISLSEAQMMVDKWIRTIGGKYFSELTNMTLLTEETGELARIMARTFGDQVAKAGDFKKGLKEEIADIFWVLTCIANQTGVNLTEAFTESMRKKTIRDKNRFI